MSDQEYIVKVLNGDTKAYSIIVDRYKNRVYSLAVSIVKNKEEAEEVAQDVFMKAFKALKGFKNEAKLSTWLYRITYNTSLDKLKGKKIHRSTEQLDEHNFNQFIEVGNALDILEKNEKEVIIQSSLDELEAEESFLLRLYYFKEQSIDEIAELMKLSASNVKVKLFRSRKKLAVILKSKLEPEEIDSYGR